MIHASRDACRSCGELLGASPAAHCVIPNSHIPQDRCLACSLMLSDPPAAHCVVPKRHLVSGRVAGFHAETCAKAHDHTKPCDCHLASIYRTKEKRMRDALEAIRSRALNQAPGAQEFSALTAASIASICEEALDD